MELIRDDPEIAGFMRNIMENKCVYWIPSSIIRDIPDKAVQLNGETYIGRSYINGSPELAEIIKLESHGNKTFATCNGKFVRYFEILCSESLGWMSKFHAYPRGGQPANTIVKLDGADVHIGRAMYQGVPLFGVVKDDVLTVHVEEDAKSFRRFQVLVATDNCNSKCSEFYVKLRSNYNHESFQVSVSNVVPRCKQGNVPNRSRIGQLISLTAGPVTPTNGRWCHSVMAFRDFRRTPFMPGHIAGIPCCSLDEPSLKTIHIRPLSICKMQVLTFVLGRAESSWKTSK